MSALFRAMGVGEPESFRCRVYGDDVDPNDAERARFVRQLADGWIETEDSDPRNAAIVILVDRGYVDWQFENASDHGLGHGKVKVWTLTSKGRTELLPLARMRGEP